MRGEAAAVAGVVVQQGGDLLQRGGALRLGYVGLHGAHIGLQAYRRPTSGCPRGVQAPCTQAAACKGPLCTLSAAASACASLRCCRAHCCHEARSSRKKPRRDRLKATSARIWRSAAPQYVCRQ
eukprot:scaffold78251_cov48-Phaeocystis_antarctica.AAC.1